MPTGCNPIIQMFFLYGYVTEPNLNLGPSQGPISGKIFGRNNNNKLFLYRHKMLFPNDVLCLYPIYLGHT